MTTKLKIISIKWTIYFLQYVTQTDDGENKLVCGCSVNFIKQHIL